ncbi:hypothetical protein JCM8097_008287 [Rhodosporidiobolus ruineniae]
MSLTPNPNDPAVLDPSNRIAPIIDADRSDEIRAGPHASLVILAVPLIAFPRVLSLVFGSLLAELGDPDAHDKPGADVLRTLNVLERSLAGLAGMSCLALAAVLVVQTGAIPLNSNLTASRDIATASVSAPFRAPTIWIAVAFFGGLAYTTYDLGLLFAALPSGVLSAWGLWVLLFAHEGRVNRAGSKTANFPFKNVEAKEEKREKRADHKDE